MTTSFTNRYRDKEGNTRLLLAIEDCPIDKVTDEIVRMIKNNDGINLANDKGYTPLILAAEKGKTGVVKMLIAAGAELDCIDRFGYTALNTAAQDGSTEIVSLLIAAGAKLDIKDIRGRTAVMNASVTNKPDVITLLAKANTDINEKDTEGRTALIIATTYNNIESARALVKCEGIDLNAGDKEEWWTALMHAANHNHTEIMEILINAGANPTMANRQGSSALDIAYFMVYDSGIKILERAEKQWAVAKHKKQEEERATRRERTAEALRRIDEEMEKELKTKREDK